MVCDISDPDQIDALYGTLDREFGRIDILGNVAGEGLHGDPVELTPEQIQLAMQNLVIGRFHSTQQAGRRMIAAGKGSIMSIVSIAGFTALGRHHIPYSMAMGAVAQMTRELSSEWAPLGVRVNAIVCAQVENQGLQDRMEADPVVRSNFLRGLPIGRLGRPEGDQGPGDPARLRRVVVHDRRARPPGRRQSRQERGRIAPRHAAARAVLSAPTVSCGKPKSATSEVWDGIRGGSSKALFARSDETGERAGAVGPAGTA